MLQKIFLQAENESLMKDWVTAIDDAATAIIVDERKDLNKLRKLTSFRWDKLLKIFFASDQT